MDVFRAVRRNQDRHAGEKSGFLFLGERRRLQLAHDAWILHRPTGPPSCSVVVIDPVYDTVGE